MLPLESEEIRRHGVMIEPHEFTQYHRLDADAAAHDLQGDALYAAGGRLMTPCAHRRGR